MTRVAPSPTGYLHLGVLYMALVNRLAAGSPGSVFYFRLEDTDKKREVEGGARDIVDGLRAFGIATDEGFGIDGSTGEYGPYRQSERGEIYACVAKSLVERGLAYPSFKTAEELDGLRRRQEQSGARTGYYGEFADDRDAAVDEVERELRAGRPFVLRLKSPGSEENKVYLDDAVKGRLELTENDEDFVLLKSDGIPTYHFAHVVDDHFMRTTHVIRGDEWVSSAPKHLQLFRLLGWKPPKYAHVAPIMKQDGGARRKISKRKDPEAAVRYFIERGYEPGAVTEYLMTVVSSEYEPWRRANRGAAYTDFPFSLRRMSVSGALFDGSKLEDVAKNYVSTLDADAVTEKLLSWSREYDPELFGILSRDREYTKAVFSIDRGGVKPRKDIARWSDARDYASYFYDELYTPCYDLPENIAPATAAEVARAYLAVYRPIADRDEWFALLKSICPALGFAAETRDYRADPGRYRGSVGDAGTVVRVAVTGRRNTPDLCAVMSLLGEARCRERLEAALRHWEAE